MTARESWRLNGWMAGLAFALALPVPAHALPSFAQVKASYRASDTVLLDRHGQPLHQKA